MLLNFGSFFFPFLGDFLVFEGQLRSFKIWGHLEEFFIFGGIGGISGIWGIHGE